MFFWLILGRLSSCAPKKGLEILFFLAGSGGVSTKGLTGASATSWSAGRMTSADSHRWIVEGTVGGVIFAAFTEGEIVPDSMCTERRGKKESSATDVAAIGVDSSQEDTRPSCFPMKTLGGCDNSAARLG